MHIAVEAPGHAIAGEIGRPLAEMELGCPPVVRRALTDTVVTDALGYLSAPDIALLQDAVGEWLEDSYGWAPPRKAIRPVADLVAGFRAVLTHLLPAGEPIIVPTPAYMPFISLPEQTGHPVIEVPMLRDGAQWQYDFEALRTAFERGARLLVLCNPHNPIGKVATEPELAQIEALVAEFDGLVFADEIHAPMMLADRRHLVYAARTPRAAAHTITATSASKAFNIPGTKCGQLVFTNPEHLVEWQRIGHWYEHQTSVLGVVATAAAYGNGRPWLTETMEYLRGTVAAAVELLTETADRTGIRIIAPEATYLLWLDLSETGLLREGVSAADTVRDVAQVVVSDGEACGAAGRGWVRFNSALPRPVTLEAMRRVVEAASLAKEAMHD